MIYLKKRKDQSGTISFCHGEEINTYNSHFIELKGYDIYFCQSNSFLLPAEQQDVDSWNGRAYSFFEAVIKAKCYQKRHEQAGSANDGKSSLPFSSSISKDKNISLHEVKMLLNLDDIIDLFFSWANDAKKLSTEIQNVQKVEIETYNCSHLDKLFNYLMCTPYLELFKTRHFYKFIKLIGEKVTANANSDAQANELLNPRPYQIPLISEDFKKEILDKARQYTERKFLANDMARSIETARIETRRKLESIGLTSISVNIDHAPDILSFFQSGVNELEIENTHPRAIELHGYVAMSLNQRIQDILKSIQNNETQSEIFIS